LKPEALLKSKMVDHLKKRYGTPYIFRPVQMGMGESSVDILCCINGRFVAIEAKIPGEVPTARQNFVMAAVREAGGLAFWADSVEGMMGVLEAHGL
jgi:hypothetical protein